MHIQSVSHNLHSTAITPEVFNLGPRQIITGRNRSGKTAICDAIALALASYIPRLGKSGDKLEPVIGKAQKAVAVVSLSEGQPRAFSIEKKANGSITKTSSHKDALTPFIIDSSLFLAAKPAERIAMIQNATGVDPQTLSIIYNNTAKAYPLAKRFLSKSSDLGDYAIETDANLAQAIKESKACLDRQKKALAAQVEHGDDTPVDYNEADHNDLKKSIRTLENIVHTNESLVRQASVIRTDPTPPALARPELDVILLQKSIVGLSRDKANIRDKYLAAEAAVEALACIEIKDTDVCPTCGSCKEHWKNHPNDSQELNAVKILAKDFRTLSDKLIEIQCEIDDTDASLGNAIAWEKYDQIKSTYDHEKARHDTELTRCQVLLEKSRSELPPLQSKLEDMDKARDVWTAQKVRNEQSSLMEAAAKDMEKEIAIFTEARQSTKDQITSLSNQMMEPVLEKARKFTDGIMPPLVSANFRIGYIQDEQWVPLEAFCGSEMAVATAALQAALQTQGDLKTIIIDEAQRIDPDLLAILAGNIDRAIFTGIIEQAIIIGSRLEEAGSHFGSKFAWQTIILS